MYIVLNKGALFIYCGQDGVEWHCQQIGLRIWSEHHLIMQPKSLKETERYVESIWSCNQKEREREMESTMEGMSWGQGLTRKPKRGISRKPGIGTNPNIGTNTLSYRFWNCYHLFLVRENNPKPFPSPHFFLRAPPSKAWPDTQSQLSLHSPWVRCLLTGKS